VSRRLAEIHRRQAVHAKTRTTHQSYVPPGGFWKNPENSIQ